MAWTEVNLIRDAFEDTVDGATGERVFACRNDEAVGLEAALTASHGGTAVPALGTSWSTARPFCTARSRSCKRVDPWCVEVTVRYASGAVGEIDQPEDLLSLPARITRTGQTWLEPYQLDASSTPKIVRNTAGDPFDAMPERQVGVGVFQVRKYVNAAGRTAIDGVWNTVNNATVSIDGVSCAAGTLWMGDPPTFTPVEGASGIYEAQYQIKYKKDGWDDVVLNYGFRALVDGELRRITEQMADEEGNDVGQPRPCTLPWPLNLNGTRKTNQADAPEELTFTPYASTSWASVPVT